MKQDTGHSANNPNKLPHFWVKRFSEGGFILIFALALFILLSLSSYQTADPGWSKATLHPVKVANAGGRVGAYLADGLYWLFGYLSYLLPMSFAYLAGMILMEQRTIRMINRPMLLLRALGLLLLIPGGCGLSCLLVDATPTMLNTGGRIGDALARILTQALNGEGALLLLLAMVGSGLTWLTALSWLHITEWLGKYTWQVLRQIHRGSIALWQMSAIAFAAWQQQRQQRHLIVVERPANKSKKNTPKLLPVTNVLTAAVADPKIAVPPPTKATSTIMKKRVTNGALPSLDLLEKGVPGQPMSGYSHQELETLSREVEQHLLDFGIQADVVAVHPGPVITRFELQLAAGVKVSRLTALAKDLARSLSVISVRVVEIIPGKTVVGIELPNPNRATVCLADVLSADVYQQAHSPLTLALGVDIAGHPMVVDLAKMPHLLVAGTTGSGKSVGINAMILSLLYKAGPEQVRLILIDPKMLELSIYDGIPHLLAPVVTDMKEAASALRWCVAEMERRYRLMATLGVRNIVGFNTKVTENLTAGMPLVDPLWKAVDGMAEEAPLLETLPYVVVVIDELADMMMVVGKKVEQLIARIAQKARAAGIHLILATQRPSVDVLTGLIKSNIPTRISFQVSSKIDSRTILDQQGAEQLLGYGDMLFLAPGTGAPLRVHGAFVDDQEVHRIADDWRSRGEPQYVDDITQAFVEGADNSFGEEGQATETADPLYDQAVEFVIQTRKASISAVQRRFKIGYNRAARLIEEMERVGLVGPLDGGYRDVLVPVET